MSFRDIFNQYYDEYFKVNPINKGLKFIETDKSDVVGWETQGRQRQREQEQERQRQQEALSSPKKEDVFVIKENNKINIKQYIDSNIYTEATIDTLIATGSIIIHDSKVNKDYECVKIIIDNKETNIDDNLLKILSHPNYKIDNSFMFTIIKSGDVVFNLNDTSTYSIIYSFNNFINVDYERYNKFKNYYDLYNIQLPNITHKELTDYDIMIKKIINNLIIIKLNMVNNISRLVQPNDIFFYKMRISSFIPNEQSSPVTNIHLDGCNWTLSDTDYTNNHHCEVSSLYYINIVNARKYNYNSSAMFFFGPEIPNALKLELVQMENVPKAKIGKAFFDQYKRFAYSVPIKSNSYVVWYNKPLKYKKFNIDEYSLEKDNIFYNSVKDQDQDQKLINRRIATTDSNNYMMHLSPIPLQDDKGKKLDSQFLSNNEDSNFNRSFINPRLSNMNIFSTIRYIYSFDSDKNHEIQIKVRNNNLYSLCYIILFYLSFEDFNSGEISFNLISEKCSKILKDILIKTFDIDLDKIVFNHFLKFSNIKEKEKKYYRIETDIINQEYYIMNIVKELIEQKTELITYQAKRFQELIRIKYETYFLNKSKDSIPFNELYKYLSSIQESINLFIPHIPHTFNTQFLKHIEEKDEQYYKKKYLKYKSKYVNIKK